jgi:precorrin-4 methylase
MVTVVRQLLDAGYTEDSPVAIVYRVGWPDEQVIRGTLADIAEKVRAAKITLQALIMVGQAVDPDLLKPVAAGANGASSSHLYSSTYTHLYRRGQIGAPYTDAERDAGS